MMFIDLYTIDGVRVLYSDIRDGDPSIVERLGVGLHTFDDPSPRARSWRRRPTC